MSTVRNSDTTIAVVIYNWYCLRLRNEMVLDAREKKLVINHVNSANALKWILIPNLTPGASTGGYTIFNPGVGLAAQRPNDVAQPILLDYGPTVYGSPSFCWTLWPGGSSGGEQLWMIQDSRRGPAMDTKESCDAETEVLLLPFNARDNQKWVIRRL